MVGRFSLPDFYFKCGIVQKSNFQKVVSEYQRSSTLTLEVQFELAFESVLKKIPHMPIYE